MDWSKPKIASVWRAIELYLNLAHGESPPAAVRAQIDTLKDASEETFFESPALERDVELAPTRYSLRLGNKFYPHMKLVMERAPDGKGHFFRADTHCKHIQPSIGSREFSAFAELMQMNQDLAQRIEAEWDRAELPTFKRYLREDLARRTGRSGPAGAAVTPPAGANKP